MNLGNDIEEYEAKAKTWFVMSWGMILTKWSALAGILAGVLEAVKLWLSDNSSDLALLTQNKYYSVFTLVLCFAIPILRNLRQGSTPAVPAPVEKAEKSIGSPL